MRFGIAAFFAAVAAMSLWPRSGYAADWVGKATEQQQAHCAALEELSFRGPCLFTYSVRGLTFPYKAEEPGIFTKTARMGIFKPKGEGPFPALLILHSCAAVDFDPDHIRAWVNRAVKEGYVAFVVDSWGQRGIPELCRTSPPGFLSSHLYVRARDGYEALAHLRKFSFVDIARVGAVGFSNGGRTSYMLGRHSHRTSCVSRRWQRSTGNAYSCAPTSTARYWHCWENWTRTAIRAIASLASAG